MNFAPHEPVAAGRIIGFAASSSLSPRHFQFGSPHPETSSLFSTSSELFAHFCSARLCFQHFVDSFRKNMGGVPPGVGSPRIPVSRSGGVLCVDLEGDLL
jgi:hypothetical protein